MDEPIPNEFRHAVLLSWPSLPEGKLEEADLVFDHGVDLDSLEELLIGATNGTLS